MITFIYVSSGLLVSLTRTLILHVMVSPLYTGGKSYHDDLPAFSYICIGIQFENMECTLTGCEQLTFYIKIQNSLLYCPRRSIDKCMIYLCGSLSVMAASLILAAGRKQRCSSGGW